MMIQHLIWIHFGVSHFQSDLSVTLLKVVQPLRRPLQIIGKDEGAGCVRPVAAKVVVLARSQRIKAWYHMASIGTPGDEWNGLKLMFEIVSSNISFKQCVCLCTNI